MTSKIFLTIFNKSFFDEGFGLPAQISKKDIGMLNHWITHLKSNLSSKEIADIARDISARWKEDFAGSIFNTVEGKKLTFPTRPNLRTILYCKNDVASFLLEDNTKVGVGVGRPIIPK